MSAGLFTQIVNIGLIVIFILIIAGFLIAGLIGFKRGIWSSAFRMIFMFVLVLTGLISLSAIANTLGHFDLSGILPWKTIVITNEVTSQSYYAPVTSLHDTLVSAFRGYYLLYHASGSYAAATEFAEAFAYSVIKLVAFIVVMVVIVVLGNILATLLWHIVFKRFIPKLARKRIKVRWASVLMGLTTYTVVGFLLISPLSSLCNIVNQNYTKRSDEENQVVAYLNGFVSAYDNSLFAQTFFNWTVDDSTGMTLDATILNGLTSSTLQNGSIGIVQSISELTSIANVVVDGIVIGENGFSVSIPSVLTQDTIENLFYSLKDSNLIMMILPIAVNMCVSSDLLAQYVDLSSLDLSDANWQEEMDALETFTLDLLNSGIADSFFDENGNFAVPSDVSTIVEAMLTSKAYAYTYHALSSISSSKLLSRAIPVLIDTLVNKNESMKEYFPDTFDALSDIDWGFELSVVYDSLYQMYSVDNRIVPALMSMVSGDSTSGGSESDPPVEGEATTDPTLIDIILENIDDYSRIIIGETNASHQLINLDSNGRTVVYSNGKKISGRRYSLMDTTISKSLIQKAASLLGTMVGGESTTENVQAVMDSLSEGKWMKNYKEEFNSLFYCLSAFKDNPDALTTLTSGNLVPEGGSISDIDDGVISTLSKVMKRMDSSRLIYAILVPTIKSLLTSGSVASAFESVNISTDIITDGIDKASADTSRTLGVELAKIIDSIKSFGKLTDVISAGGDTSVMVASLAENDESIAHSLDTIYTSKIINPVPVSGDSYATNENFFNVMSYIFGDAINLTGLTFDSSLLTKNITWANSVDASGNYYHDRYGNTIYDGENGMIANVIRVLGKSNILSVLTDSSYLSGSDLTSHLADLEKEYHLSSILTAVNGSQVFSSTMGTFLDVQLESMGILDNGVSFTNVTNWADEGNKLGTILLTIGDVAIDLSTLDFNSVSNIVGLNDLLHALADSSIFIEKTDGSYLFSSWLYAKVKDSLTNFSDGTNTYDLIKDPEVWDSTWGTKGDDDYTIVSHDFASLSAKEDWYSEDYTVKFDVSGYVTPYSSYADYWDNPAFIKDYEKVMDLDEIGRLAKIVYYVRQAVDTEDLLALPTDTFVGLIDSLNNTNCLRISTYNFFEIAKSAFTNSTGSAFFDLSPAYTSYLVSCDLYIDNIEASRSLRQTEIDYLTGIYTTYRYMVNHGILDSTNHIVTDKINAEFSAEARKSIKGIQESYVFHRKGSCLDASSVDNEAGYNPTVFQNGLEAFMTADDLTKIVYNENSPKDQFYYDTYLSYLPSSVTSPTQVQLTQGKTDYLLDQYFDPFGGKKFTYSEQLDEIDAIFTVVDAIVGGPIEGTNQNYNGLRKANSEITFDFDDFDLTSNSNIVAISQIFNALNDTTTMFDCVSNSIARALENAGQYSVISGFTFINFADLNIFYQYFDPDNLFASQTYNFNARLTDDDVSLICDLLGNVSRYQNGDTSSFPDFSQLDQSASAIVTLDNFLHEVQESKLFHTSGPVQSLTVDGSGAITLADASSKGMTVFQEMCAEIFNYDTIASCLYSTNSPKDIAHASDYSNAEGKAEYLAKSLFTYNGSGDSALTLSGQSSEIDNICDFMTAGLSFNVGDFSNMDVNSINASDAENVLLVTNNSASLYDAVPNLLNQMFGNSFSAFSGVSLSDASCYYHYTLDGTTNYNIKYDVDEIHQITTLLTDYQLFSGIVGNNTLDNLAVIKALVENNYLYDILSDIYNSNVFHLHNEYLTSTTHMTVFEQVIKMFVDSAGLTSYAYATDADNQMMNKIKAVTALDTAYKSDVTTLNATGYHENWLRVTNDDEIHALVNFVSVGQQVCSEILGGNGTLDVATFQIDNLSPEQTKQVMTAINQVDFLVDVVPVFVKQSFDGIGLSRLATYNSTNYANFNIGQYAYGGKRYSTNNEYCEINNIYYALVNMEKLDSENNCTGYHDIDNMIEFASQTTNFDGILRFLSHSRIFNTDSDGNFNTMWTLDSHSVSTRGLVLYNIMTAGSSSSTDGASLGEYITGTSESEKIATLSKIFTFSSFDDQAESKGLYTLAQYANNIDGNNLDTTDFNSVAQTRHEVTLCLKASYDAYDDNTNVRSYFCSEIMSSLIDKVMATEFSLLDASGLYYEKIYFGPTTYSDVLETGYENVNAAETSGLNGSLSAVILINNIVNHSVNPTRSEIIDSFTLMDNSQASKVIYLSRIYSPLGTLTQSTLPVWADYTSSVYASGFSFSNYGTSLANYLNLA